MEVDAPVRGFIFLMRSEQRDWGLVGGARFFPWKYTSPISGCDFLGVSGLVDGSDATSSTYGGQVRGTASS